MTRYTGECLDDVEFDTQEKECINKLNVLLNGDSKEAVIPA